MSELGIGAVQWLSRFFSATCFVKFTAEGSGVYRGTRQQCYNPRPTLRWWSAAILRNTFFKGSSRGMANGNREQNPPSQPVASDLGTSVGWPSIEGFRIVRELHRTPTTVSYLAAEQVEQKPVVVEVPIAAAPADWQADRLFPRTTGGHRLSTPQAIRAIGSGIAADGRSYMIWPYVEFLHAGSMWGAGVTGQNLSLVDRLLWFDRLCRKLDEYHRNGLSHRSLNDDSIYLRSGAPELLQPPSDALGEVSLNVGTHAYPGEGIGRLPYASPESVLGRNDEFGAATDVYALGVILYQIVTNGAYPFDFPEDYVESLNAILFETPKPLRSHILQWKHAQPDLPKPLVGQGWQSLESIISRCLRKQPLDRYHSAGEIADDLIRLMAGEKPVASGRYVDAPTSDPIPRRYAKVDPPDNENVIEYLYESLAADGRLPSWTSLASEQRERCVRAVIELALNLPGVPGEASRSVTLDAETIAAIRSVPVLLAKLHITLESFLSGGTLPPSLPPPSGNGGDDDDSELRQVWQQLIAEQRAILRFVYKQGIEKVLTYRNIADNIEVPHLPGQPREGMLSDKTVGKHCKTLGKPPLSLLDRAGERGGIRLTIRGHRIVMLHDSR